MKKENLYAQYSVPDDYETEEESDWDFFVDSFNEVLESANKEGKDWHVEGEDLDWRHSSGFMDIDGSSDAMTILRKVSPKTDCYYDLYYRDGDDHFTLIIYSHDVPTGSVLEFTLLEEEPEE